MTAFGLSLRGRLRLFDGLDLGKPPKVRLSYYSAASNSQLVGVLNGVYQLEPVNLVLALTAKRPSKL